MKQLFILLISILIYSCQVKEVQDIVVIGGGLMGSSAAWQLSKEGAKVLLIEQQDSVYSFGSSFGEARVSRSLGPKGNIFSFLQQRSIIETQKLIEYLNVANPVQQHKMEDIYTTSPITYIHYKSNEQEVNKILDDQQDKYEYASNAKMAKEMFGMVIPDSIIIIREYKKHTGTLNPKALISKLHKGIKKSGSKVIYNEKVINLKRKGSTYEIELLNTKTGNIRTLWSEKVVSAAGPYTGTLLRNIAPYFEELINPKRLFLSFFKLDNNRFHSYSNEQKKRIRDFYPIADWSSEIFYSMIEKNDELGIPILKIGGHMLRTSIDNLDLIWQKELSIEEIEWSKNNTLNYFKMINIPLESNDLHYYKGYSCVYSLTESEIPYVTSIIMDQNKPDPNFVVLGGMSGVGAKGALTYGLIAADILLNKKDTTELFTKTKLALGFERLLKDVAKLKGNNN